jgi:hypothetical protein
MKLDIACGNAKPEGFVGIDRVALPGVDLVHDLDEIPWPIAAESVTEARCSHYFEHVERPRRPAFMDELWRILVPGGTATLITPLGLTRQFQDFSHAWPVFLQSYLYFDSTWLAENRLEHYRTLYGYRCDFRIEEHSVLLDPAVAALGRELAQFGVEQWTNAATDLRVILQKVG